MKHLLPFIENQLQLSTDEEFRTQLDALEQAFTLLCETLVPLKEERIDAPVFFSLDSYYEALDPSVPQEDKFEQQIQAVSGIPHAKICHMRYYQTAKAGHWHALFAQMDESGHLKQIFLTDSRVRDKKGITAHRDLEHNLFLKRLKREDPTLIQFIKSISQPSNTASCWLYALANLAALATEGTTYQRKRKTGTLGQELCSSIKKRIRHNETARRVEDIPSSVSEISAIASIPPLPPIEDGQSLTDAPTINLAPEPVQEPIAEQEITIELPELKTEKIEEKGANVEEKEAGKNPKQIKFEAQNPALFFKATKPIEPNKSNLKIGLGLLASGTGLIGLGFSLSPIAFGMLFSPIISLPLSITLIALGSILALSGIIILAKRALTQSKSVDETLESDGQLTPLSGLSY